MVFLPVYVSDTSLGSINLRYHRIGKCGLLVVSRQGTPAPNAIPQLRVQQYPVTRVNTNHCAEAELTLSSTLNNTVLRRNDSRGWNENSSKSAPK
jgi:hypothetical protein